jgi:hypothetical protein
MKTFASFQRQLNLYDFKRIGGRGENRGGYRHKMFVHKDDPALANQMKRTKITGGSPRSWSRSQTTEPLCEELEQESTQPEDTSAVVVSENQPNAGAVDTNNKLLLMETQLQVEYQ